jgi:uncharacterized damage-inducible protein DinB
MKEQLLEAWRKANQVNLIFIDQIPDEGMEKTLSLRGGRTVADQLWHLYKVRTQWLEVSAKDILKKYKEEQEGEVSKKALRKALETSAKAIEELIDRSWANEGKLTGFKKGLIPFIAYLVAHEAHHRGNILLTLKQSGIKIPEALKWSIWDWNR